MKLSAKIWLPLLGFSALLAGGFYVFLAAKKERQKIYEAASPAEKGAILMLDKGCLSCHQSDSSFRAPILKNLYGRQRSLTDGRSVFADAIYIRRALLEPKADVVEAYQPVMPSYAGLLSDEEIAYLIAAMKPSESENGIP